jgi:hypothetical protein
MELVKVYVTKYCLTNGNGISEETLDGEIKKIIRTKEGGHYFMGEEAFIDKEDAVKNANKRKEVKLKSLRKSIEKIENLKFD